MIAQILQVENYYLADLTHCRNCDYSTIYFININVNNNIDDHEVFWYHIYDNDLTIPMKEIYIVGYGRQLSGSIIYWTSNFDSNVIYFSKCIYQHYTFGTTVKKFRFYQDGVTIEQEFTFLCSIMLQSYSWFNDVFVSCV